MSCKSKLSNESVAYHVVNTLVSRGVDTFFGIPGGPVCPIFEAIRANPNVTLVESRHESHAAFSATAYYKATGKVAAVVVTAGPGATNAVTGVASAYAERAPMLIISGDAAWATHGGCLTQDSGPEGFNIDLLFSPITTRQVRVTNGRSAISQLITCFDAATNPLRPGPALFILPIDKGTEKVSALDIPMPVVKSTIEPSTTSIARTAQAIAKAKRPLIVLGAGCNENAEQVKILIDTLNIPFITTPRAKGVISENHPMSLRNGGMAASLWARKYTSTPVDFALVLGTDLDDTSVGPTPYIGKGGMLVHVDIDPRVFNRNLPTDLGITSDISAFCKKLYEVVKNGQHFNTKGVELIKEVRSVSPFDVANYNVDIGVKEGLISPHRAVADLQNAVGDAKFVSDIGEHMLFALHYLTIKNSGDFQIQLKLGSMGGGIAGAIGAAMDDSGSPVVCICGDGGMHMSGMEILTALKLKLPIVYAVFNDGRYNMVHHGMKQIFGVADNYDVPSVDFSAWASSMEIPSEIINKAGQITPKLLGSLMKNGGPVLLDIRIDSSIRVSGGGRVEALQHMSMLQDSKGGK